jgi:hypothetical protein
VRQFSLTKKIRPRLCRPAVLNLLLAGYAVPIELKFHHAGVSVPDLEASIRWYRDVLGFEVEQRFEIPNARAKVAMIKRGALRMELFQVEQAKPLPDERRIPDHVCRPTATSMSVSVFTASMKPSGSCAPRASISCSSAVPWRRRISSCATTAAT